MGFVDKALVGAFVGDMIGATVIVLVGFDVGERGAGTGALVGAFVGDLIGAAVIDLVGFDVGERATLQVALDSNRLDCPEGNNTVWSLLLRKEWAE